MLDLAKLTIGQLIDNLAAEHARPKSSHYDQHESREFRRAVLDEIDRRFEKKAGMPS